MEKPKLTIIGSGRVGTAMAVLALRAGYPVSGIWNRSFEKGQVAQKWILEKTGKEVPLFESAEESAVSAEVVMIGVSDHSVQKFCEALSEKKAFQKGASVVHFSGALSSEVLASAREKCECRVGSLHPLQAFPTPEIGVQNFPGSYSFIEGDPAVVDSLTSFSKAVGAQVRTLSTDQKMRYHASLTIACNFTTAVIDVALDVFEQAGIERQDALQASAPVLRATIENILNLDTERTLTGSYSRGDANVISGHLEAVRNNPFALKVYRLLGERTAEIAKRKGVNPERLKEVFNLLSSNQP